LQNRHVTERNRHLELSALYAPAIGGSYQIVEVITAALVGQLSAIAGTDVQHPCLAHGSGRVAADSHLVIAE
jgi:hypothetical protein